MATIVDFSAFLRHQLKLTVALKELNFKGMLVILHTCIAWSIYTLFLGKMLQVYSPLAKNNYKIFMVWELSFWNQFFFTLVYRYIENITWQNLYHTPHQPETPIWYWSRIDMGCDTNFVMYCCFYYIFEF